MKDRSPFRDFKNNLSRRKFIGQAASAGAVLSIVPRHVLGGPGYVPPSEKVNVAFIGVGAQGLRVMLGFLRQPDVQGVSVCDVNKGSGDYPQWDDSEFCKSVRRLLGVSSGWEWLSPNQPIQLTRSMQVTGGMAGREPCQKIVEGYYGNQKRSGQYRGCTAYSDFRELLEKEKDVDAVVVCTTDNLHAAVSVAAMKRGKHVFCQKPMTHTIYEARRVAEVARETGRGHPGCGGQPGLGRHTAAVRMGVGWCHRAGAPGHQLVKPAVLASRPRPTERRQNRCRRDWIGTCGSVRRRNAPSTAPTCPLSGAAGTTLVAARSATWAAIVSTLFSVC